jgi:hypothetical protein
MQRWATVVLHCRAHRGTWESNFLTRHPKRQQLRCLVNLSPLSEVDPALQQHVPLTPCSALRLFLSEQKHIRPSGHTLASGITPVPVRFTGQQFSHFSLQIVPHCINLKLQPRLILAAQQYWPDSGVQIEDGRALEVLAQHAAPPILAICGATSASGAAMLTGRRRCGN